MVGRYSDLPSTIAGLDQQLRDPNGIDLDGCVVRNAGKIHFAFGKHRGEPLEAIAATKPGYLRWMMKQPFLTDTKKVVRAALARSRN